MLTKIYMVKKANQITKGMILKATGSQSCTCYCLFSLFIPTPFTVNGCLSPSPFTAFFTTPKLAIPNTPKP